MLLALPHRPAPPRPDLTRPALFLPAPRSLTEDLSRAQAAAAEERRAWEGEREQLRLEAQAARDQAAGAAREGLARALASSRSNLEAQWPLLGMHLLGAVDVCHAAIVSGGSEEPAELQAAAAALQAAAAAMAPPDALA